MLSVKGYIFISILIVCAFIIGLLFNRFLITGNVVQENEYSLTKAICNSGKCIDVEIMCKGDKVLSVKPVSDIKEINPKNLSTNLCG